MFIYIFLKFLKKIVIYQINTYNQYLQKVLIFYYISYIKHFHAIKERFFFLNIIYLYKHNLFS